MTDIQKPLPSDYGTLLAEVKERIRSAQYEALKTVNREMVTLYWDIGRMIHARQQGSTWGKSIVQQLAGDLQNEFPGVSGFDIPSGQETAGGIQGVFARTGGNRQAPGEYAVNATIRKNFEEVGV